MSDTKTYTDEFQNQSLEYVRRSQESVVNAVQAWAENVQRLTFNPVSAIDTDRLPEPTELVDRSFDLAEQLLAAQRDFAHRVLDATSPALSAARQATETNAATANKTTRKAQS